MTTRNQLARYAPAMPERIDLMPGHVNGVDVVTPHLQALYNNDPDVPALLGSLTRLTSPNGAVWADKTVLAQKVKVHAAKNGNDPVIGGATLAVVAGWISWSSRRFGVARSQLFAQAKAAMLAAQAQPDSTPAE